VARKLFGHSRFYLYEETMLSFKLNVRTYFSLQYLLLHFNVATTGHGVNFTKLLSTAFTLVDPKSVKKIGNLTVFFTLLGTASVKR